MDPSFDSKRLSLLDRGFVYAIAHGAGGWRAPAVRRGAAGGALLPLRALVPLSAPRNPKPPPPTTTPTTSQHQTTTQQHHDSPRRRRHGPPVVRGRQVPDQAPHLRRLCRVRAVPRRREPLRSAQHLAPLSLRSCSPGSDRGAPPAPPSRRSALGRLAAARRGTRPDSKSIHNSLSPTIPPSINHSPSTRAPTASSSRAAPRAAC